MAYTVEDLITLWVERGDPFLPLDLGNLGLTELPPLPDTVTDLNVSHNELTTLEGLPPNLESLACAGNPISDLPELPPRLIYLCCSDTPLSRLPQLPSTLQTLYCNNTFLEELPALPEGLLTLCCTLNNRLFVNQHLPASLRVLALSYTYQRNYFEPMDNYISRISDRVRTQMRTRTIRPELVGEAYHPRRVEKWLEHGGWDTLDSMFGH